MLRDVACSTANKMLHEVRFSSLRDNVTLCVSFSQTKENVTLCKNFPNKGDCHMTEDILRRGKDVSLSKIFSTYPRSKFVHPS